MKTNESRLTARQEGVGVAQHNPTVWGTPGTIYTFERVRVHLSRKYRVWFVPSIGFRDLDPSEFFDKFKVLSFCANEVRL